MLTESSATVSGTLNGDGSLVIDEPLRLPPGPVRITVETRVPLESAETMWTTLERIWADQDARGHIPPSREEIEAYIAEMRSDWDEREEFLDRIRNGEPLEPRGDVSTEINP